MRRVAIIGVGQTKFRTRRDDATHEELTFEGVSRALEDAALSISQIESFVYGTMDPFDGVNSPDKWCVGGAGAIGKPYIKISTGGTTGLTTGIAAYHQVASGAFDIAMAVCTQRVGVGDDAQSILNTCVCPIFERDAGAGAITVGAQQASRHMFKYGSTDYQRALVSVDAHKNALNNPYAHIQVDVNPEDVLNSRMIEWPLRLLECCPRSDGACAVIFASEEQAKKLCPKPAWVWGEASIIDSYWWGERPDLADWDTLSLAGRRLFKMAGIENPLKEIDVAELYAPFTSQILLELEALGFCGKGEAGPLIEKGVFKMGGEMAVNPSGGVLCTNPIGATGLVRLVEACLQVTGKAEKRQVPDAEVALAHAWGGTMQLHALMIVGKHKR